MVFELLNNHNIKVTINGNTYDLEDSLKNFYTTYINDNISIVKQTLRDIDIGVHEIE